MIEAHVRPLVAALLAAGLLTAACEKQDPPVEQAAEEVEEAADEADQPAIEEKAEAIEEAADEVAAAEVEGAEAPAGQWVESPAYGVKFRVPTEWEIARAEGSVSATAPDGTTTVIMVGSESESVIQSAVQDLQKEVEFKDVNIGKSDMTVINGLAGYKGSGSAVLVGEGEEGDQEIQFTAYSLKVGEQAVSLMIFSEAEMYEAQKEMIEGIGQTITRSE